MALLSTIDSGFLVTESHHSPKHIGSLMVYRLPKGKGPAWLRKMLDDMRQHPPSYPLDQRIKRQVGLLFDMETDDRFEIDYHVRHTVLPRPGNDRQLNDVLARMHANLLDRDRPLWEFHLIEGLSDRRFALYFKVHHAMADGITFGRWIDRSTVTDPKDLSLRPIWAVTEEPEDAEQPDLSYAQIIQDGVKALGGGIRTAIDVSLITAKMVQRRFFDKDDHVALPLSAPRTPINVHTGAARAVSFTAYRLEALRAIGKSQGGTINDVVMTMCDMAVSRYFDEHGTRLKGPLVAYMPVSIRTAESDGRGNLVTLLQVKLASRHEDPLDSLAEVRESIDSAREVFSGASSTAEQYYSLMVALLSLFEELLNLDRLLPPVNNMVISNVPGSRVQRYLRGAESIGVYPVSTLPPLTALNVTACSFAGTMYFGLIAGRTAIPDLDTLTEYLDDAFFALAEATGVSTD
ncbi:MAG: wax ester/triacylglycerol synthase family O-acyltransferase [Gammaproteobacteria bacterium]|nr:wax ester/triacylglycerol synthase family O-acyltransferase [Gammaproteobacteria bacterium]